MNKNILLLLNKNNLKTGKLADLIPEFYELKNVVENNDWHNKETVFKHTLSVLDNLEKIIRNLDNKAKQTLNKKIGLNTRGDLLRVATLFHDIAKKETIVDKKGTTFCLNHEDKGSIKAKKILKRFHLSSQEIKFILKIVKNHGLIHKILPPENQNFQKESISFKKKFFHNIYPELILLAFADTIGSYLIKSRPTEFKSRISFYRKEIKNLPPKEKLKLSLVRQVH